MCLLKVQSFVSLCSVNSALKGEQQQRRTAIGFVFTDSKSEREESESKEEECLVFLLGEK